MLSINTNLSSLIAQNSMSSATKLLNQAVERMTTGYKINHAKDNAANYSISTNLTTKINAYMVAEDNCAMGLDMLSTANGSLDQISDKLTRLRDLQTQASNGTYGATSLNAINAEVNALVDEINRLYQTAEYNGKKLFASSDAGATPAVAAYGARAAGTNTTYTDEEVAAMTKLSTVDVNQDLASGTYSISTVEELQKIAELANNGKLFDRDDYISKGVYEFVLANDIDLSSISNWTPIGTFIGTFDGNGHVISNLKGTGGLFQEVYGEIKNIGLENVNIKSASDYTGGLLNYAGSIYWDLSIENCYVTGSIEGNNYVGGLVGYAECINIKNSYVEVRLNSSGDSVAGIIGGVSSGGTEITNCFAIGEIVTTGSGAAGILASSSLGVYITNSWANMSIKASDTVAGFSNASNAAYENCYSLSSLNGSGVLGFGDENGNFNNCASLVFDPNVTQMTAEEIAQTYTPESMGFTEANGWKIVNGQPVASFSMAARNANSGNLNGSNYITLQIGINSGESSGIGFDISFALGAIDDLRMIGLDTTTDYLTTLDNMLSTVNAKQTEFGAVENRLNSALDEISIQYENLVSSRSTIRDADIAEVSSEYIRQQILQQASATLLSTANQSPSIALQLI